MLADDGLLRLGLEVRLARLGWHPKDILGVVLIQVLRGGTVFLLADETWVHLLKGVGYVFEEDQAEHNVLVFGGALYRRAAHRPCATVQLRSPV